MLDAARLHDRLWPYLYSQAVRWYLDGYPWTMAPLPIAFPDDPHVYGRENDRVHGYEWMIGDSLLATPLYGNDYETSDTRDVYLPAGIWIDYDNGDRYQGPKFLKDFALPPGKTPLFVGGTGIVGEKRGTGVVARVYAASPETETVFFHRDGISKSIIRIRTAELKNAAVSASHGKPVAASWERNTLEFVLEPGVDYEVH
jgi:alpha-glucosidase (family GH31 glycosyl hydrolase)